MYKRILWQQFAAGLEITLRRNDGHVQIAYRYLSICLTFQTALWIIYEIRPTWLTSKLSRFMAHLGFLIMSSSFFSRVSILLSAPCDMSAASVVKSWVKYEGISQTVSSLRVKLLCPWLMAVGLPEQPWALSPPKSPPPGIVCTMRRKYSQNRLPVSQKLVEGAGLQLASCLACR